MQIVTKSARPIGTPYLTHGDGPKVLVFWQMVQHYARSVECPGAIHPGIVFDQNLKLSHSPNAVVYAVSTNDVIGTARVSNGVLCRNQNRLKFTFSQQ